MMKGSWGLCPSLVACMKALRFPATGSKWLAPQAWVPDMISWKVTHASESLTSLAPPASFSLIIQRFWLSLLVPWPDRVPNLISISDLVLLLAMSAPFPEGWLEMPSHCWPWSDTRLSAAFIYLPPTSLLHLGSPMAAEIVDLEWSAGSTPH